MTLRWVRTAFRFVLAPVGGLLLASVFPIVVVSGQSLGEKPEERRIQDEIAELKKRIEALEKDLAKRPVEEERVEREQVDLSEERIESVESLQEGHIFSRDWYRKLDLSGFGAFGYLDSGDDGARPHGGFLIKETSLFLDAQVWEDMSLFFEVQFNRLGRDSKVFVRTGEVHAHFRNVLGRWGDDLLGIKVGRVDIPFGEEYLWQDASDNPLISNSAAYPYGLDEGVVLYGNLGGVGWIASVTDGLLSRSIEDIPSVPDGRYTLRAWHECGGGTRQQVSVFEGSLHRFRIRIQESQKTFQHKNKFGRSYRGKYR